MGIQVQPYCCARHPWVYYPVYFTNPFRLAVYRTRTDAGLTATIGGPGFLTRLVSNVVGEASGNCLTLDEERSRVIYGGRSGSALGGIWDGPINPPAAPGVELARNPALGTSSVGTSGWAIDLENEQVYYFSSTTASPTSFTTKVMRANLDGTNKTEFLPPPMYPGSLYFDQDTKRLYYVRRVSEDPAVREWRRISRDGTQDELLFSGGQFHFAAGWDIDLEEGLIFLLGDKLRRCNLDGSNLVELTPTIGNGLPFGMPGLDRRAKHIYLPTGDFLRRYSYTGSGATGIGGILNANVGQPVIRYV